MDPVTNIVVALPSEARPLIEHFELRPVAAAGRLVSVAGGGDTVAALNHAGVAEGLSYVSTAGGAFLEWMEGRDLPCVTVLTRG